MYLLRRLVCLAAFTVVNMTVLGCAVKLVAPYNPDLQQKASSMQAEVAAWDLTMRSSAGTISDDPRNPDVAAMINKWHGDAEAMLTLAVSNEPGMANCNEAAKGVYEVIQKAVPADLHEVTQSTPSGSNANAKAPSGCEAGLVALIDTGIGDVENALKYCKVTWVPDTYFASLVQNRATAPNPPNAPDATAQTKLYKQCLAEFKVNKSLPANAAGAKHGRAVSSLLTTLQSIVYVENRKKAAESSK